MELRLEDFLERCPGREYYETRKVKSTRKVKRCSICTDQMPKGSSHVTFKFYGYNGDWPGMDVCYDCEIDNKDNIVAMRNHSYD